MAVVNTFIWRNTTMNSIGDIVMCITKIISKMDRAAALDFMVEYRKFTPDADANIGYISGYFDKVAFEQVMDWFEVSHPLFGKTYPNPIEALEIGKKFAENMKDPPTGDFPVIPDWDRQLD
jgi:hypothetical protein